MIRLNVWNFSSCIAQVDVTVEALMKEAWVLRHHGGRFYIRHLAAWLPVTYRRCTSIVQYLLSWFLLAVVTCLLLDRLGVQLVDCCMAKERQRTHITHSRPNRHKIVVDCIYRYNPLNGRAIVDTLAWMGLRWTYRSPAVNQKTLITTHIWVVR